MATNDGYSPYPLGLTASQATEAITRAYNLSTELNSYVKITQSAVAPAPSITKNGDHWVNTTTGKLYRVQIVGSILTWFEV